MQPNGGDQTKFPVYSNNSNADNILSTDHETVTMQGSGGRKY